LDTAGDPITTAGEGDVQVGGASTNYFPELNNLLTIVPEANALEETRGFLQLMMDFGGVVISAQCNSPASPYEAINCGGFANTGTEAINDADLGQVRDYNAGIAGKPDRQFTGLGTSVAENAAMDRTGVRVEYVSLVEPDNAGEWTNLGTSFQADDTTGTIAEGSAFWTMRDGASTGVLDARTAHYTGAGHPADVALWARASEETRLAGVFPPSQLTVTASGLSVSIVLDSSIRENSLLDGGATAAGYKDVSSAYQVVVTINEGERLKAWKHWMEIAGNDCKRYTQTATNGDVSTHDDQRNPDKVLMLINPGALTTSRWPGRNRQPVPDKVTSANKEAANGDGKIKRGKTDLVPGSNDDDFERLKNAVGIDFRDERPSHPRQYACCVQEMARSFNEGVWTVDDKRRLELNGEPHPNFVTGGVSVIEIGSPRNLDHRLGSTGQLPVDERIGGAFYLMGKDLPIGDMNDTNFSEMGLELDGFAPGQQYQFDLIQEAIYLCDAKIALGTIISPLGWLDFKVKDEIVVQSNAYPYDASADNYPSLDVDDDYEYDSSDDLAAGGGKNSVGLFAALGTAGSLDAGSRDSLPRKGQSTPVNTDCEKQIDHMRYDVRNMNYNGICYIEDYPRDALITSSSLNKDKDTSTGNVDFRSSSSDYKTTVNHGDIKTDHKAETIWFQELVKRANQSDNHGYFDIDFCKMPRLSDSFRTSVTRAGVPAWGTGYEIKTTRFGPVDDEVGRIRTPNRFIRLVGETPTNGDDWNPTQQSDRAGGGPQTLTIKLSRPHTYSGGWRGAADLELLCVDCKVMSNGFDDDQGNVYNHILGVSQRQAVVDSSDSAAIDTSDAGTGRNDDGFEFENHPTTYKYWKGMGGWKAGSFEKNIGPEKEWQRDMFYHMVSKEDFDRIFKVSNWTTIANGGKYTGSTDEAHAAWSEARRNLLCPHDVNKSQDPASAHYITATFKEKFSTWYCSRKALNQVGLVMDPRRGGRIHLNDADSNTGEIPDGHEWPGWEELGFDPEIIKIAAVTAGHGTADVQYDIEDHLRQAATGRLIPGITNGGHGVTLSVGAGNDQRLGPRSLYGRNQRFFQDDFMNQNGVRAPKLSDLKSYIYHLYRTNAKLISDVQQGQAAVMQNGLYGASTSLMPEIQERRGDIAAIETTIQDSSHIAIDADGDGKVSRAEHDALKDHIARVEEDVKAATNILDPTHERYDSNSSVVRADLDALRAELTHVQNQHDQVNRLSRVEAALEQLLNIFQDVTGQRT
jgi:hypothetical protein